MWHKFKGTPQSVGKAEFKQGLEFYQHSPLANILYNSEEFEDCAEHFLGTLENPINLKHMSWMNNFCPQNFSHWEQNIGQQTCICIKLHESQVQFCVLHLGRGVDKHKMQLVCRGDKHACRQLEDEHTLVQDMNIQQWGGADLIFPRWCQTMSAGDIGIYPWFRRPQTKFWPFYRFGFWKEVAKL